MDKSDLIDRLDRILDWIKSCDTKASIVIAGIGVFLTISASENTMQGFNKLISAVLIGFDFSSLLYVLFFLAAVSSIIYGVINLISVLVPRLSGYSQKLSGTSQSSLFFFDMISNMDYASYKQKMLQTSGNDEIEDLLSQIYINAHICNIKYSKYRKGVIYSFAGIIGVVILYGLGFLLLEFGGF